MVALNENWVRNLSMIKSSCLVSLLKFFLSGPPPMESPPMALSNSYREVQEREQPANASYEQQMQLLQMPANASYEQQVGPPYQMQPPHIWTPLALSYGGPMWAGAVSCVPIWPSGWGDDCHLSMTWRDRHITLLFNLYWIYIAIFLLELGWGISSVAFGMQVKFLKF